MRFSRKRAGDEKTEDGKTVKGASGIMSRVDRFGERERWSGGERDIEGKTDGGARGRLGYLQITSLCDRFLWRLNWARGLRGNQSKS